MSTTPSISVPPPPPCASIPANITIAVIGDVHEHWDDDSAAALASLDADVAVFVGDFANENVDFVKMIANVTTPIHKVVMAGNHEAWYSLTPRGKQRASRVAMLSSSLRNITATSSTSTINEILDIFGDTHVGFSSCPFPELGVTFVGGRPFSKGGKRWSDIAAFYRDHYGVESTEESAQRIVDEALSQPPELPLIIVGHNGPTGLGATRNAPCGVDWQLPEEDFGDPDLGAAVEAISAHGRPPALVLFGHMHHMLKGGGRRDMAYVDEMTGTVYLNSAVVPRIKKFEGGVRGHHFLMVRIERGVVGGAQHIWAAAPVGLENNNNKIILAQEEVVKVSASGDGSGNRVVCYYRAHSDEWMPVVVAAMTAAAAAGEGN